MKAEEFVQKLAELAPSVEQLISMGITRIDTERQSYFALKKLGKSDSESKYTDELFRLANDFNLENVEIASITFFKDIKEFRNFYIFGKADLDLLSLNKDNGEIVTLDYTAECSIMYECALDGNKFLDALSEAAKYFELCGRDDSVYEDNNFAKSEALRFANLAGNPERYYPFYSLLLGCEE